MTLWMFNYMFCSKFAFVRKLILRTFCNWTSKQLLTSKPSLTIALKILKTIEKPLTPMVGPSKNIQWWWSNVAKTIEKPLTSMVAWKKTLTIPSLWKIDHRRGLINHINGLSENLKKMLLLPRIYWRNILKLTVEKNQTNVTSVIMHALNQVLWRTIWKRTMGKS